MVLVLYGHPYPTRSRGCAALLAAIADVPGIAVRALHDLYPDFDIDVAAEQKALVEARAVVWLHPLYWYGMPGLMKVWQDQVLRPGFAFGQGGTALSGKPFLWATTTGGGEYAPQGVHHHRFADFVPPIEATILYCGMEWLAPFVVPDVHHLSDAVLRERGAELRERVAALGAGAP